MDLSIQSVWILNKAIDGIEALIVEGAARIGSRCELPNGAQLLICGAGFDEHTTKVFWSGHYYFVYTKHLNAAGILAISNEEPARLGNNAAAGGRVFSEIKTARWASREKSSG